MKKKLLYIGEFIKGEKSGNGEENSNEGKFIGTFYKDKKVFVTGHTGFKGSWLSIWLKELGAEVIGIGLEPATPLDNFVLSGTKNAFSKLDVEISRQIIEPDFLFYRTAYKVNKLNA